jgi:hypothetical protein
MTQNDLLLPTHLITLIGFLRLRSKCYLIMSLAAVLTFSMMVNGHINSSDILLIFNCSAPLSEIPLQLSTACDLNIINSVKLSMLGCVFCVQGKVSES